MTADRVPDTVWQSGEEDTTPACSPHCHQAAKIEALGEWLQRRAETDDRRHSELLAAVIAVRSDLSTLQGQVVRIAAAGTETAVAVVEQTQRVQALTHLELSESTPPPSRGRRRLPPWALQILAGLGALAGTAWAAYEAARR